MRFAVIAWVAQQLSKEMGTLTTWNPVFALKYATVRPPLAHCLISDLIREQKVIKPPQEQTNEEWTAEYNAGNVSHINPQKNEKPKPARFSRSKEENSLQDDQPLITPGKYIARYISDQLRKGMFEEGACKLRIEFKVSGNGLPEAVNLEAWFPVKKTKDGFSASKRSTYAHQFFSVFPDSTETRMDRLSPRKFKGLDLEVEVITVTEDSNHNPKPKALHYSKVKRIIGRKK